MSTDRIKDALIAAHPNSVASQWKRRSKKSVAGGTERLFENAALSLTVTTVETPSGDIILNGDSAPLPETAAPVATPTKTAPKPKPAANGVATLRNQMVVGSIWTFVRECALTMLVSNSERDNLIRSRYPDGCGWGRDPEIAAMPTCVSRHVMTIPAGSRFCVVGKPMAGERVSVNYDEKNLTNGLSVPIRFETGTNIEALVDRIPKPSWRGFATSPEYSGTFLFAPLKSIADFTAPEDIPEEIVYVLRDNATGDFFGGWEQEKTKRVGYGGISYTDSRTTDVPRMKPKFSSAKKYQNVSAVKASIRDFTGYAAGLDSDDGPSNWYAEGNAGKKIDLPPTWEIVAVDKTTGTEKEIIDVQEWFAELMRLRVLTAGHGSAVRAVYKKAEGKGLAAILVFQNRDRGSYQYKGMKERRFYDDASPWIEDEDEGVVALAAVNEAIGVMGGDKVRVKTDTSIAVACSVADAVAARLAFDYDNVDTRLLDFATLTDLVEEDQ